MIVKLHHYQGRVVIARVPELHAEAMREHRVAHGPKAHAYDLPAIAWRQIRDHLWLNPDYYGPLGGKLDSQPKALYRAIQLIHQRVLEMEHHPALDGTAAVGTHPEVIPAWANYVSLTPYPVTGPTRYFWLMVPVVEVRHGQVMTEWKPTHPDSGLLKGGSWTYREEAHLEFSRFRGTRGSPGSLAAPRG